MVVVVAELGSGCRTSYELQLTPDLCGVWCWAIILTVGLDWAVFYVPANTV